VDRHQLNSRIHASGFNAAVLHSGFCGNVCAGDEQFSGSWLVKNEPPPSRPAAARRIGRKYFELFFVSILTSRMRHTAERMAGAPQGWRSMLIVSSAGEFSA